MSRSFGLVVCGLLAATLLAPPAPAAPAAPVSRATLVDTTGDVWLIGPADVHRAAPSADALSGP